MINHRTENSFLIISNIAMAHYHHPYVLPGWGVPEILINGRENDTLSASTGSIVILAQHESVGLYIDDRQPLSIVQKSGTLSLVREKIHQHEPFSAFNFSVCHVDAPSAGFGSWSHPKMTLISTPHNNTEISASHTSSVCFCYSLRYDVLAASNSEHLLRYRVFVNIRSTLQPVKSKASSTKPRQTTTSKLSFRGGGQQRCHARIAALLNGQLSEGEKVSDFNFQSVPSTTMREEEDFVIIEKSNAMPAASAQTQQPQQQNHMPDTLNGHILSPSASSQTVDYSFLERIDHIHAIMILCNMFNGSGNKSDEITEGEAVAKLCDRRTVSFVENKIGNAFPSMVEKREKMTELATQMATNLIIEERCTASSVSSEPNKFSNSRQEATLTNEKTHTKGALEHSDSDYNALARVGVGYLHSKEMEKNERIKKRIVAAFEDTSSQKRVPSPSPAVARQQNGDIVSPLGASVSTKFENRETGEVESSNEAITSLCSNIDHILKLIDALQQDQRQLEEKDQSTIQTATAEAFRNPCVVPPNFYGYEEQETDPEMSAKVMNKRAVWRRRVLLELTEWLDWLSTSNNPDAGPHYGVRGDNLWLRLTPRLPLAELYGHYSRARGGDLCVAPEDVLGALRLTKKLKRGSQSGATSGNHYLSLVKGNGESDDIGQSTHLFSAKKRRVGKQHAGTTEYFVHNHRASVHPCVLIALLRLTNINPFRNTTEMARFRRFLNLVLPGDVWQCFFSGENENNGVQRLKSAFWSAPLAAAKNFVRPSALCNALKTDHTVTLRSKTTSAETSSEIKGANIVASNAECDDLLTFLASRFVAGRIEAEVGNNKSIDKHSERVEIPGTALTLAQCDTLLSDLAAQGVLCVSHNKAGRPSYYWNVFLM